MTISPLKDMFGPSSGDIEITVRIVAIQQVNGKQVEKVLLEPRKDGRKHHNTDPLYNTGSGGRFNRRTAGTGSDE